ncbi:glycosyltransferase family 31 protein [Bombardia bombarda]|uniref:Glycosyltransferase family 31 protein n=1 Tax=Bombardia bombarda TaxID=252184 RepID=A0AA39WBK9_9PEZI|nr:glycosyltransferase family 31 protein [Bombardia bombarda]
MDMTIKGPYRCFSIRHPLARALTLMTGILVLGTILLQPDSVDVREVLMKTAASAKEALSSQRPIGDYSHGRWGNGIPKPIEQTSHPPANTLPTTFMNTSRTMVCDYDMERLRRWKERYNLQDKFEYTKRYAQVSRQAASRKSITKLQQKFLPEEIKAVDVSKMYEPEMCPEPLIVPVTRSSFPTTANASDFMFGVSTTYKRFTDPRTSPVNEWIYWLTDGKGNSNGGKLILMLLDASEDELDDVYDRLTDVGVDVDVYQSDPTLEMAVRYLTLVPALYDHPARANKKWLVTCDDDTFFPSFHGLSTKFEEYDHSKPMYIGTFSEDINNIARHGSQAFGGAGVFLSVPMAKIISANYDACRTDQKIRESNSGWGPQGDILLRKCIYDNSDTKLTYLWDLWQLDLYGDPSGFYEAGIKPLSLHHYRGGGWHVAHPWHYTKVAHVCGEDCTLQRFQTNDDFIIANGFSIAQYHPHGAIEALDLNQFERTFGAAPDDKGWNLDHKLGPQRPSLLKTGRKISWDLQEATVNDDGSVSQVYVRKHDDWRWKNANGSAMKSLDGVIELVWLPAIEDRSTMVKADLGILGDE